MAEWEYTIGSAADLPETEPPFDAEATIERYRNALVSLLPPGRSIAKSLGSGVVSLLEGFAVEFARVHEQALLLLKNINPFTVEEELDTWEEALGLPGPCVTTPTTVVAERQGAIVNKLRGRRSHSQPDVEAAAAELGYTDLEFEHFPQFVCGESGCGDTVRGDEWAYVVRISVPVDEQEADDQLVCTLNELRRSHGIFDIVLEGPMGATRVHTPNYFNNHVLNADMVVADLAAVELKYGGYLSIQCRIDNGAGGAPTDTVVGIWELWVSSDGETFTQWDPAAVTTELGRIAGTGNNLIEEVASFPIGTLAVPGQYVKVRWNLTSGGAGNSRATMHLTTW